jgi:tRNA(fMet)-specific endonuclease VapC
LDTNICIEVIRSRGARIVSRLRRCEIGEVGISSITLAELAHGVEKSANPDRNRIALQEFCAPLQIAPFDDLAALAYGRVRDYLERRGKIIGPMDLLIAAHAFALDATLITNNLREFQRVPKLIVENWN